MDDLSKQITMLRTELNLTQDSEKRGKLTKQLNVLLLKQEIQTINKRIEQLNKY